MWSLRGNVKGPPGPQGGSGAQGDKGDKGDQGVQGPVGVNSSAGSPSGGSVGQLHLDTTNRELRYNSGVWASAITRLRGISSSKIVDFIPFDSSTAVAGVQHNGTVWGQKIDIINSSRAVVSIPSNVTLTDTSVYWWTSLESIAFTGGCSLTGGQISVTEPGYYMVNACVRFAKATFAGEQVSVFLRKNGSTTLFAAFGAMSGPNISISMSRLVYFTGTEQIQLGVSGANGISAVSGNTNTYVTMHRTV